jgi:hypothetical protein
MGRTPDHWKTSSPRPNGLMARPGTESSNPSPSSAESAANFVFGREAWKGPRRVDPRRGNKFDRDPDDGVFNNLVRPARASRLLQVCRRETFGEAGVNRPQQLARLLNAMLVSPKPRETRGRSEFSGERALPARPVERLPEMTLGRRCGCGRALQRSPSELGHAVALRRPGSASLQCRPANNPFEGYRDSNHQSRPKGDGVPASGYQAAEER